MTIECESESGPDRATAIVDVMDTDDGREVYCLIYGYEIELETILAHMPLSRPEPYRGEG